MQTSTPVVSIDKIEPRLIHKEVPFKAKWSVVADAAVEAGSIQITFLTDDARLLLCDSATDESPAERTVQVEPGARVSKETTLFVRLRKGLRNEGSRDGSAAPLTLHVRIKGDDMLAFSEGYDIEVADLAKRTDTKIFL